MILLLAISNTWKNILSSYFIPLHVASTHCITIMHFQLVHQVYSLIEIDRYRFLLIFICRGRLLTCILPYNLQGMYPNNILYCTFLNSDVCMVAINNSQHFRAYVYSVARDCDSGRIDPKVTISFTCLDVDVSSVFCLFT